LIQYRIKGDKKNASFDGRTGKKVRLVALAFARLRSARPDDVGDEDKKMFDVNV
jgi:hypothetical protein